MKKVDLKKAWNSASEEYQKIHKISPNHVHYGPWMPTESELKLLGNVRGKKVLEIGCGGGQCSIAFAKRGALVTGLDPSEEQLNFAKKLAEKERVAVDFIVGRAENLKKIKSGSVDIVFSAYALQYVKTLGKCFGEAYRVLKKGGIFVFSFDHPMSNIFVWGTLKVRKSYFEKGKTYWNFEDKARTKAYSFDRPLESIFDDLVSSGFIVEKILEPMPVKKDKAHDFKLYPVKILKIVPYTIIFKCRK
jgi:ubiquinone/menaquinone biosynthesis C-methylase UbiE